MTVRFSISKRYSFSASHRLMSMPVDHPCYRLHGHNYEVEAIIDADGLDERGMVVDYHEIDKLLKPIIARLDHQHLNDVLGMDDPTAELIANEILEDCELLTAVRVSETPKTWAEAGRD